MSRPRNISAEKIEWRKGMMAGGGRQVAWGLETALAAEKCAFSKAKVATLSEM
ncbi:MAG: hypothetical protein II323_04070 [Tidjanibacter sp.]|nr:hypothetical protein [Tidjanibacter sp.]